MSSKGKKLVGKLKFKGDNDKKKRKKADAVISPTEVRTDETPAVADANEEDDEDLMVKHQGTGRITSSSTTIHGHYTAFMDEIRAGDAIIIVHPTSLQEEMKVVRMVVSNISMSISSAFSTDLISTTPFKCVVNFRFQEYFFDTKLSLPFSYQVSQSSQG